jgi:kynurenine formamidase
MPRSALLPLAASVLALSLGGHPAAADTFLVDLTHPLPTFAPTGEDITKPDLTKPYGDSQPVPTFGVQAVLQITEFPTNQGHFDLGRLVISEHHGTHVDAPGHYINTPETKEAGNPPQKLVHDLGAEDLIGKAVIIDISARVQAELDKNGGKPSPDKSVTDFSNASPNVVTADDIAAVADKLGAGAFLVVNLGWSRFFQDANWDSTPYFNGWNFPGLNKAAIDKLIEIEDQKGFRINGIVIDNIGVDTGESSKGIDDKFSDSFYSHVRGLQRGWKFVENAANLGQLAEARPDSCTIIVGAPKHVRGTGGPSRILAMCEK